MVIAQPLIALLWAIVAEGVIRPLRLAGCFFSVLGMTPTSPRRYIRAFAYVVEACWLARHAKRNDVSHFHAHFGTNSTTVVRLAARLSGIPYSFTNHGPAEFDAPLALDLKGKVQDAKFVAVISCFGRSQLIRYLPPDAWNKLQIVRCGLEFQEGDAMQDDFKPEFDFCFVGRLAPQKGLPTLASALMILKAEEKRCRICIIGEGELSDWLREFLYQHQLTDDVTLAGARSGSDVLDTMRRSGAFILPSYAEGLPVVIMEAFACKRPVVTTMIAGIPELVTRECGLLVPAGDAAALAEAMREAMGLSVQRRRDMGEAGYQRVRQMHDITASAEKLEALFRGDELPIENAMTGLHHTPRLESR